MRVAAFQSRIAVDALDGAHQPIAKSRHWTIAGRIATTKRVNQEVDSFLRLALSPHRVGPAGVGNLDGVRQLTIGFEQFVVFDAELGIGGVQFAVQTRNDAEANPQAGRRHHQSRGRRRHQRPMAAHPAAGAGRKRIAASSNRFVGEPMANVGGECLGARITCPRPHGKRFQADRLERCGDTRIELSRRRRRCPIIAPKRTGICMSTLHRGSRQTKDIGPFVVIFRLARGLLGRHVGRRAQHRPGLRLVN